MEKTLSDEMINLFEIEYLDTMADVQGDVYLLVKKHLQEFKEELKDNIPEEIEDECPLCKEKFTIKPIIENDIINKLMLKHFGDKLI